jgi:hypothetical protein
MFNGLDSLELKSIDFRFQLRGNRPANPNIVVVAVDEASIAKLGRWPWPRATHAKLIRELTHAGAKAIAFDVLFTEKDEQNPASDAELAKAGVGTLVDMHIPEDALKELKKLHVNVINAGHMASDSIGANIFLDLIEKKGVEIIAGSGLIRVRRNK